MHLSILGSKHVTKEKLSFHGPPYTFIPFFSHLILEFREWEAQIFCLIRRTQGKSRGADLPYPSAVPRAKSPLPQPSFFDVILFSTFFSRVNNEREQCRAGGFSRRKKKHMGDLIRNGSCILPPSQERESWLPESSLQGASLYEAFNSNTDWRTYLAEF